MNICKSGSIAALCALLVSAVAVAAEPVYSPYVDVAYPTQVFWGDTHLHTTNSLDARLAGVTLDAEDAYRFARGEQVLATTGQPARLARPLDFLVVTDHSDAMGAVDQLLKGNPELLKHRELRELYDNINAGSDSALQALTHVILTVLDGDYTGPLVDKTILRSAWDEYVDMADRYNEPGRFTALIGYEWTPTNGGDKLHRNVLYRDNADKARRVLPFTANESLNPQDLWAWMARYEKETGGKLLALAHNGNLSNGQMFPVEKNPDTGAAIDVEYVAARARWEPLYEVTQFKGDGETHPALSPNDEFADFETWDRGNVTLEALKEPEMLQYEYARQALKNGLKLQRDLGVNPYQFGMVGSTDSHTALATAEENNFFGKMAIDEPGPKRMESLAPPGMEHMWKRWEFGSSGYAAVWAKDNTRASIWDAMRRKEVYATTGPRITVRFFGGWDFSAADSSMQALAARGYAKGVPMGGTLAPRPASGSKESSGAPGSSDAPGLSDAPGTSDAPGFIVGAAKDPLSGHLDRIQIVKGWLDKNGKTHEKVYNVVWGDAHRRDLRADGTLPAVGNTVNVEQASWTNSIGDAELVAYWQDPDFDELQAAVYYARVLEIPTPRWPAYDAKIYGSVSGKDSILTLQERAYTSPIWYQPAGEK